MTLSASKPAVFSKRVPQGSRGQIGPPRAEGFWGDGWEWLWMPYDGSGVWFPALSAGSRDDCDRDAVVTNANGCTLTGKGGAKAISKMALLACWLVVLVMTLPILALAATPIAFLSLGTWQVISYGVVAIVVVFMAVYMVLTVTLRCPACRRCFLIESSGPKHPAALKRSHLGHWGTTVLDVTMRHQFVCMYCGTLCRVE
jgi:hypothetical protein